MLEKTSTNKDHAESGPNWAPDAPRRVHAQC